MMLRLRLSCQPSPRVLEPVPVSAHAIAPDDCVLLFITIPKGYILRHRKDLALDYLQKKGIDVDSPSIHGLRPYKEQPGMGKFELPILSRDMEDDISQHWYMIDDDDLMSGLVLLFPKEQYNKHGWKINQLPSMFAYFQFTLQCFRRLNLDLLLTQIRQSVDHTHKFVDRFGQTWYSIRGDDLLRRLEALYTSATLVLSVFRQKRMRGWFIEEMRFCHDVTDGTLVDSDHLFPKSDRIINKGGGKGGIALPSHLTDVNI